MLQSNKTIYLLKLTNQITFNQLIRLLSITNQNNIQQKIIQSKYRTTTPDTNIPDFVFSNCEKWPEKPAITCGVTGRSYNYGTLKNLSYRMARALLSIKECDFQKNDTIGLLLPNIPEYIPSICGGLAAGLRVTFANPLFAPGEILRQFENAQVKLMITTAQFLPVAELLVKSLPNYKSTICIGEISDNGVINTTDKKIYNFQKLLSKTHENVHLPEVNGNDVSIIPYSSGTSGLPKGVLLTHHNCMTNVCQLAHPSFNKYFEKTFTDFHETLLTIPPFFHIYGYNAGINFNLLFGNHIITLPKFTPNDYINALIKYRPQILYVVPSLLQFLGSHPNVNRSHLDSVNEIIIGGSAASESIQYAILKKCRPDLRLGNGYGMSESSPVTLLTPFKPLPNKNLASVGELLANTEARIIPITNENESIIGDDLNANEIGELLIRGPQVMLSYLNNEKATKETLDEDGWLHTGDVAYYDEDEYFYIVDRTKELIKVKGNQVSPTELERLILELPEIADVAIIGIPDEHAGELPRAFITLKPSVANLSESHYIDLIQNHVKNNTTKYKWLTGGVQFIDSIPRNPSGKIIRNELKLIYNNTNTRDNKKNINKIYN